MLARAPLAEQSSRLSVVKDSGPARHRIHNDEYTHGKQGKHPAEHGYRVVSNSIPTPIIGFWWAHR